MNLFSTLRFPYNNKLSLIKSNENVIAALGDAICKQTILFQIFFLVHSSLYQPVSSETHYLETPFRYHEMWFLCIEIMLLSQIIDTKLFRGNEVIFWGREIMLRGNEIVFHGAKCNIKGRNNFEEIILQQFIFYPFNVLCINQSIKAIGHFR